MLRLMPWMDWYIQYSCCIIVDCAFKNVSVVFSTLFSCLVEIVNVTTLRCLDIPSVFYINNSPFTSYATITPHDDSWSNFFLLGDVTRLITYVNIIATYIEHATTLRSNNVRVKCEYKCIASYSLMSGSSLEGKAFLRSHKTLNYTVVRQP